MSINVKVDMDPDGILSRRGLGISKRTQILLANEVAKHSDPYIPFSNNNNVHLKNNKYIAADGTSITYKQKYAARQWDGNFKHYSNNASGLRGGRWTERMWQARGREILDGIAKTIGGKPR